MGALEETIARIYKLHFHFIKILPRLRRFFEPSQMRNGKRCHSSENVCKLKHARWKFDFHFADTWNAIPKLRKLTPNSTATKLALVWKIPKIRGKYWYTAYPESYVIVSDSVSRLFVCGGGGKLNGIGQSHSQKFGQSAMLWLCDLIRIFKFANRHLYSRMKL